VSEAVQTLFAVDQERLNATQLALEQQDIIRQEISVCIDPRAAWLSGESRLWIESPRDHVLLLLDDGLRVRTVRDARGDTLLHTRVGDVLEVFAPASASTFPLEMILSYEGQLVPADGALVSDDVVVLGPDFHWYPVSDARDPSRLRVEVRYPRGYSSVVSGTLAGMAPSLAGAETCTDGDVWDVPTPVTRAGVVVGRLESSLTVVGDVFFGSHTLSASGSVGSGAAGWQSSPSSVPSELIELLRFLETCFGAYPYEWLNVGAARFSIEHAAEQGCLGTVGQLVELLDRHRSVRVGRSGDTGRGGVARRHRRRGRCGATERTETGAVHEGHTGLGEGRSAARLPWPRRVLRRSYLRRQGLGRL